MSRIMLHLLMASGLVFVSRADVWPQTPRRSAEDELPQGALARLGTLRLRHGEPVLSLAFTPDGKTLASSSSAETCFGELATRKRPLKFKVGSRSLAYSSDGKRLAVAGSGEGGFLHLLDAATGQEVRTIRAHPRWVNVVAFAPDGKLLASAGKEGTIRLWDAASGREANKGSGHGVEIRAVAFAADGRRVATASGSDHTIRIWNTGGGPPLLTIEIPCANHQWFCSHSHAKLLAFAPDAKTLICDNKVFDADNGRRLADLPGPPLAVSADGKLLAGLRHGPQGIDDSQVAVWQRATDRELAHFSVAEKDVAWTHLETAAFCSDGRLLGVGLTNIVYRSKPPKETVFLHDLAARKLLRKVRPSLHAPAFLAISADGSLLATSAPFGQPIQLWRVADGKEVARLAGVEQPYHWTEERPIAFSPDGKLVASDGKNSTVVLWETIGGQEVHRLIGHRGTVRALAFAADGRTLLSAGADTTALLWSLAPPGSKKRLGAEDAVRLWRVLAGDDAAAAYRAAWQLAQQPDVTLALLKERLHPRRLPGPREIDKMIRDLDSDEFFVREAACDKLRQLRSTVEPALRKELANKPTLEARKRMENLLDQFRRHPVPVEELRQLRAVQLLEWMKLPAADALIERLAGGSPLLRNTRDAKAALQRRKVQR